VKHNISLIDRSRILWEKAFLDLLFPKRCVDCGKEGNFVCFECAGKIEPIKTATCAECGKISKLGRFCPSCKTKRSYHLNGLTVAARYDVGPTKEMIHHFKYSGFTDLAIPLTEMIYQALCGNLPVKNDLVVVPVPLHKNRESTRGFNQAELIAKELSKRLKVHGACAIARIKDTETQVNLTRELRIQNLAGAFSCTDREFVKGKNILLVDDVATTLTTLNECAKVLKDAGARKIWGAVVARRI